MIWHKDMAALDFSPLHDILLEDYEETLNPGMNRILRQKKLQKGHGRY